MRCISAGTGWPRSALKERQPLEEVCLSTKSWLPFPVPPYNSSSNATRTLSPPPTLSITQTSETQTPVTNHRPAASAHRASHSLTRLKFRSFPTLADPNSLSWVALKGWHSVQVCPSIRYRRWRDLMWWRDLAWWHSLLPRHIICSDSSLSSADFVVI